MNNNNSEIIRRPKTITLLCWVTIIYSLLDIATAIMLLTNYDKLIEEDYRLKELFSPGVIFSTIIINIPIIIGAVGLYRMKKWGAWVFIGANVVLALIRYSYGEQFQYESGISPYIAFIVPGLCIGIVIYFYKYLSDSPFPELKAAAYSPTIKQDSSVLLSKLEQLHNMKEEGKLTEEEYLMMKSKVMSALTGKVVGTKTETKKAEDQTLTNKSKYEKTPDPLNQSDNKQSEDSGILGKLEQLHKMKEEGKLSDEEYNIMKSKVMSALTGKEIQSVTETKKVADETPINTQEKKENFTESQTLSKVTEDTGPAGKIQQLYQMKEKGMISEEEFNSMKSKILLSMIENKEPQKSDAEHKDNVESPLVTKAQEKNKVSSSSSQSYQSYDSKDKLQISKKVIYGGVALILLALGFVFVYPKFSQEDDSGITKLAGLFSDESKKEEKNNKDLIIPESKKIEKKEIGKTPESIIYEATKGKFSKMSGTYRNNECNETVGYEFFLMDLNDDNIEEVFQIESGSGMCYGKYGCEMNYFFKNSAGFWVQANNWLGCYDVKKLSNVNKGYHDIQLANGPTWRWNGKEYEFFSKNEGITNEEYDYNPGKIAEEYKDNSGNLGEASKSNTNYSKASDIVKSWIESLGKRDFETAYNLMSPSLSKSYAIFTSPNRYGGIVKTSIHSVETVSSSGCNFVVVASYDSFDPSNRDGKFTERFNVNKCFGYWQISNIKNISKEYFR